VAIHYFRGMKKLLTCIFICTIFYGYAQDVYKDSLNSYIVNYVQKHEVVTGDDKQFFRFFPVNEKYKVIASFEKAIDSKWFNMETSGAIKKTFRVYGVLHFIINDTLVTLNIYQSQNLMNVNEYKDHLFLPFTDISSGEETYAAGRYIDLNIPDIINNKVVIDFNKAYNPYCAYVSGKYNCPIPPKENQLPVAITAGEKTFAKSY
jgi:uncharacterized protein (DUF1684 family)